MREVVLQVWCDECHDSEPLPEGEAVHVEITIDNPKSTWEKDLCSKHTDELLDTARADGKPVRKARGVPNETYPCDICGFGAKTEGGLALHKTKKHDRIEREPS